MTLTRLIFTLFVSVFDYLGNVSLYLLYSPLLLSYLDPFYLFSIATSSEVLVLVLACYLMMKPLFLTNVVHLL